MKQKLALIANESSEESVIDPTIIAQIESSLTIINRYEKEFMRPIVLLSAAALFFVVFRQPAGLISSFTMENMEEFNDFLAKLGIAIPLTALRVIFGFGLTLNFAAGYYYIYKGLTGVFNQSTNLSHWVCEKVFGKSPDIHLENLMVNHSSILTKLDARIKKLQSAIETKAVICQWVISPVFIYRSLTRFYPDALFQLENFLMLVVTHDTVVGRFKLISRDTKHKTEIKKQLNELTNLHTNTVWEEINLGFFVLKLKPDRNKKETYKEQIALRPQHLIKILKNIFIAHDSALVLGHQGTSIAVLVNKAFSKEEMSKLHEQIELHVKQKIFENKILYLLNRINKLLVIDLDWDIHYCKTEKHSTRYQFSLTALEPATQTSLIDELSNIFKPEQITRKDEIVQINKLPADFEYEIRNIYKRIQNKNSVAVSGKSENNTSAQQDADESESKHNSSAQCSADKHMAVESKSKSERNKRQFKDEKNPNATLKKNVLSNIHIFWGQYRYRSDKEGYIHEIKGRYLKKGSYFGYFDRRLKDILTTQQFDHYQKIADDGRVVPRRKHQGIVACHEYVKGPDHNWHLSIFKLKDPTQGIRVHGIETQKPVMVKKQKRHLIEFSVVKIK